MDYCVFSVTQNMDLEGSIKIHFLVLPENRDRKPSESGHRTGPGFGRAIADRRMAEELDVPHEWIGRTWGKICGRSRADYLRPPTNILLSLRMADYGTH